MTRKMYDTWEPKNLLIRQTQIAKSELVNAIEGGLRSVEELEEMFKRYISFQQAADILNGYIDVKGETLQLLPPNEEGVRAMLERGRGNVHGE